MLMNNSLNLQLLEYVKSNNLQMVKVVIDEGANVNFTDERNNSLLHFSASDDNLNDISFFLLEKGADPNIKDEIGNTPMHIAAYHNNLYLLEKLKEFGGNINSINDYDWTLLHTAASGFVDDWSVIKWLLTNKLDPESLTVTASSSIDLLDSYRQKDYSDLIRNYYKRD
jgi:Ankyrin repeats (many copies)